MLECRSECGCRRGVGIAQGKGGKVVVDQERDQRQCRDGYTYDISVSIHSDPAGR